MKANQYKKEKLDQILWRRKGKYYNLSLNIFCSEYTKLLVLVASPLEREADKITVIYLHKAYGGKVRLAAYGSGLNLFDKTKLKRYCEGLYKIVEEYCRTEDASMLVKVRQYLSLSSIDKKLSLDLLRGNEENFLGSSKENKQKNKIRVTYWV